MNYQNPVIRGFHPDPSICRVGDDFYLVTSSFEYFPAIPVFHSRDLANWEQIGNCISFENTLDLTGATESGGVWAPTIRYWEGTFYVTAAMEQLQKNHFSNFIVHTKDIYGTWSDPVWVDIGGIDPSLFFEDGKAYYCTNDSRGEIRESVKLGVVDPVTGETLEAFRTIWHGEGGGWMEAPHIYHIGEWYYILCAEGGTSFGHHEVAGRARNIWGPYEACPHNPILTNRNDTSKQASCCGHADLVDDPLGNWWMVHLGHRTGKIALSALGRETFLTPVAWQDGWPVIRDGRARILEEGPLTAKQLPWRGKEDDFTAPDWPCWWYFVRNPRLSHYIRKDGSLTVIPFGYKPQEKDIQGFVCTKQPDLGFRMEAGLSFFPEKEGEAAGLLALITHEFYYFFGMQRAGGRMELFLERRAEDIDIIVWREEITEPQVRLVMEGTKDAYTFLTVQADGTENRKCCASARFLSNGIVGRGFTGTMIGLYAESPEPEGTPAVFSAFRLSGPAQEEQEPAGQDGK